MNHIKQGVKWLRGKQTISFERREIDGISQVTSVDHCLNYSNYSPLNLTVSCTQISLCERPGIHNT